LLDFGISVLEPKRESKSLSGTVGYIAPETIETGEITEKCDIYNCGIVLNDMLSGRRTFSGDSLAEILIQNKKNQIKYEYLEVGEISEKAIKFIKKLTKEDPMKRPTAIDALLEFF